MFHRFSFSPGGRSARALVPGALLLFALVADGRTACAQFTFANVADTTMASPLGGTFSNTFLKPSLNDSGTVAFIVRSTNNLQGVFTGTPGGPITTIAASNTPAPVGGNYTSFRGEAFINASGTVAFQAGVGTNGDGIFSGDALSPTDQVIALTGQAAPVSGGAISLPSAAVVPSINGSGVGVFYSGIVGGSAGDGVFKSTPGAAAGNLTKVAMDGDVAPGTSGGVFNIGFSQSISPGINGAGVVAFQSNITGGTATAGVFTGDGVNPLTAVMLTGQGAPSGGTFTSFVAQISPRINNNGRVVFGANTNLGQGGLYSLGGGPGSSVIALLGQTAPGSSGGGTFSGFNAPAINDSGVVAFYASILGVPVSQSISIYTGGPNGLNKVIQLGDSLFGSTLVDLEVSTLSVALNNTGQVAFEYSLADGRQGIALASPVSAAAAPEPCTLVMLTLGGLTVAGVKRRAARRQVA